MRLRLDVPARLRPTRFPSPRLGRQVRRAARRAGRRAARLAGRAGGAVARLWPDRRGTIAVILGFSIIPLVGFAGVAIDTTRGYLVKARLNQALDAAALAGGRVFYEPYRDEDIRAFFAANFPPDFLGSTVSPLTITENLANGELTVAATADIDTTLTRVLGFEQMTVGARSVVQRADRGMELVLVMDNTGSMRSNDKIGSMRAAAHELVDILFNDRQSVPNFWVSLVPYTAAVNIGRSNSAWLAAGSLHALDYEIDDTIDSGDCDGSMAASAWDPNWDASAGACIVGQRLDAAAHGYTTETLCNGVGAWDPGSNECIVSDAWKGCVEARWDPTGAPGFDITDDPPSVAPFRPYYWPRWRNGNDIEGNYNSWLFDDEAIDPGENTTINETESTNTTSNNGLGPNLGCGPAITPWTEQRATVEAAIDEMDSWHRGGTTTNLGLVWGWRLLSPRWRGLWGNPSLPLDYNQPLMQKVAIILTDGDNQFFNGMAPSGDTDYTGYQRLSDGRIGTTSLDAARVSLNARTLSVCNAMKAEGIIIYTITFDVATNARGNAIRDTFRSCATSPGHFFDSYGGTGLSQTFRVIAAQLSNLRIAE